MAQIFVPPTAYLRPMTTPRPHPGNSLYRHYRPIEVGINVWLLPGGVVTTLEPDPNAEIVRVFHGGHLHPVDDVEAAALTAAGYTLVEVPDPVANPGLPGGEYPGNEPAPPPVIGDGVGFGFAAFGTSPFGGTA